MSFTGRVWQGGKLFLHDLCCSQSSSSASASLFLELQSTIPTVLLHCAVCTHHAVPRAQPKPQPLTSTTLQSGSKDDPILTFIHIFSPGCKQINFSSSFSKSLTGDLHNPSSLLKGTHTASVHSTQHTWHTRSKERGCSLPECPPQTAADAAPKACRQSWLQSCCFTHSHSSHNCFPANT